MTSRDLLPYLWPFYRPAGEHRSLFDYEVDENIRSREACWAKLEPEWSRVAR